MAYQYEKRVLICHMYDRPHAYVYMTPLPRVGVVQPFTCPLDGGAKYTKACKILFLITIKYIMISKSA